MSFKHGNGRWTDGTKERRNDAACLELLLCNNSWWKTRNYVESKALKSGRYSTGGDKGDKQQQRETKPQQLRALTEGVLHSRVPTLHTSCDASHILHGLSTAVAG